MNQNTHLSIRIDRPSPTPQASVLKALKRLEDVQEMFEKRHASLKKLSAKQTRPVQPVAPRPESSPKRPPLKNQTRTPVGPQGKLPDLLLSKATYNKNICHTKLNNISLSVQ